MRRHPHTPDRRSLRRLIARFRRNERGATAVEFAFIALPFFGLLFAIMQTSLILFANQALQTMVSNASRKIMTGQLTENSTMQQFKNAICDADESVMFDCTKLLIQVQSFDNFASANPSTFVNNDCFDAAKAGSTACFKPGGPEDVVIVRAAYEWPFGVNLEKLNTKQLLIAVSAFRNEPY